MLEISLQKICIGIGMCFLCADMLSWSQDVPSTLAYNTVPTYTEIAYVTDLPTSDNNSVMHTGPSTTSRPATERSTNNNIQDILPLSWRQMCDAEFKLVTGSNFTGHHALFISCKLASTDYWSIQEYRAWISANEKRIYQNLPIKTGLLLAFEFKCTNRNATLSLPWPLRAQFLWYVSIYNCKIVDQHTEFNSTQGIEGVLRVLEQDSCIIETDPVWFLAIMRYYKSQSRQYDCGSEMLEKYVSINITKTFKDESPDTTQLNEKSDPRNGLTKMQIAETRPTSHTVFQNKAKPINVRDHELSSSTLSSLFPTTNVPNNSFDQVHHRIKTTPQTPFGSTSSPTTKRQNHISLMHEKQLIDAIAQVGQDNQKIEHQCNYTYLRYIDESYSSSLAKHHSHFLLERSNYPELQYFNLSHSQLTQMPQNLLEWRRYFPKMQYMDLSYNRIKYFSTLSDNGIKSDETSSIGVLDLRYNNITSLTPDDLETLRTQSRTVFVDIRHNPFVCDCKMTHFVETLQNTSKTVFKIYKYLQDVKCANPAEYKGRKIADLSVDFCDYLEYVVLSAPIIVLTCITICLAFSTILAIRYRREIIILAFTRLHISLPCREVTENIDKKYDAFISYCEQDGHWVFETLVPRLEAPRDQNGAGLHLCIHHRDFPVGVSIAENILDKVKDSHHTVLILTNNFLRSQWCKYEFKTAFTQSLLERQRHLVMVIKEELDKHLIDSALKRCLQTFTYVKTDDRLFWDKMIYAVSDARKKMPANIIQNMVFDNALEAQRQIANNKIIANADDNADRNDGIQRRIPNAGERAQVRLMNEEDQIDRHNALDYQIIPDQNEPAQDDNQYGVHNNMLQQDGVWQV